MRLTRNTRPIAAFALMLAILGCRAEENGEARGGAGAGSETIVVATMVDIRGVNELTSGATTLHTALHYYALFLPLLEERPDFDRGPPTFAPRLAESYELSDDGAVITFRLRPDAVWSDGVPVTAEDVRWTWQAQTHPDVAWGLADYKRHISHVEVVDPHTVRFHFDRAYATQVLDANLGVILPKHAWSALPFAEWRTANDWFFEHLVVDGPFVLERWEPDQRIVLSRNERYFEPDRPRAERVVIRVTPDRESQVALLRSGQAHMVDWVRPADAAALEADPEIEILSYLPRGSASLVWNTTHPLFAEKEVRQALTMAIDRRAIIDALYYGYAHVTDSAFTSNLWAAHRELEPWPFDPERARELLASRGWTDRDGDGVVERGGRDFRFDVLTVAGNELRQDVLVMVQDQLARVGVEARQRPVELNTLLARERSHDFEASVSLMGVGTDLDLSFYFHSKAIGEGYNFAAYSNPEVDRLLDELKTAPDQLAAKPLYHRLQELLYDDLPVTMLYEPIFLVAVREDLANVSPNALSPYYGLEEWELDGSRHGTAR